MASGGVEALLGKMTEMDPEFGKLLGAPDKESQRKVIAGLNWRARQRSFASIITVSFPRSIVKEQSLTTSLVNWASP